MAPALVQEGDATFVVELERFQGPLDLLLHLIRQQDIDIFDIPIARITRQFLEAIGGIEAAELDSAGEFLEMASTLVGIKAQMLLPRPDDDEDDDPRAELVRRLLEYEQIREIARRLERMEADRARRFNKGYLPVRPAPPAAEVPLETTWEEVFEAALRVEIPERTDPEHSVTTRLVSMEEKVELILTALEDTNKIEFRRLLTPFAETMHGVMTFLAGLELSRRRRIRLRQSQPFHELWVYLRRDEDSNGVGAAMPDAESEALDVGDDADGGTPPADDPEAADRRPRPSRSPDGSSLEDVE